MPDHSNELTVHLHGLRFDAFHGLYPQEKLTGGLFEIDLDIRFQPASQPVTRLSETVNYVEVYRLVARHMQQAEPLIESLAHRIASGILALDPKINEVRICLRKRQPPIIQFNGSVGVTLSVKR